MEKLYMLPIDNRNNLEKRVKKLRESLINSEYKIYITGQSLAVYIEDIKESSDFIINKEEKKEEVVIEYRDFIYSMKTIARNIGVK